MNRTEKLIVGCASALAVLILLCTDYAVKRVTAEIPYCDAVDLTDIEEQLERIEKQTAPDKVYFPGLR